MRLLMIVLAFLATTAPMAHVLEWANKARLSGPAWLFVQQRLYSGWGPLFGPIEIGALLLSGFIAFRRRRNGALLAATLLAVACYALMLAVFFIFNAPVNAAFAGWAPTSLPHDWTEYRDRWEIGHALAALLSVTAFAALLWAERRQSLRRY